MKGPLTLRIVAGCALMLSGVADVPRLNGQSSRPVVYAISIEGVIDLGLAPFLARTIREAKEAGAAAVLLDINTFGGRVDAAVAMRDALLNAPVRTIAFVNQRAISAGALIALACDTLIMTPGGTIGKDAACGDQLFLNRGSRHGCVKPCFANRRSRHTGGRDRLMLAARRHAAVADPL